MEIAIFCAALPEPLQLTSACDVVTLPAMLLASRAGIGVVRPPFPRGIVGGDLTPDLAKLVSHLHGSSELVPDLHASTS